MAGEAGLLAVHQSLWPEHPWMSQLKFGTDVDTDSAMFFTRDDAPAPLATLDRIVVQSSTPDGRWVDADRADGCFFPSHGWAIAAVGWYRPWSDHRALLPAGWDVTRIQPQAAVPLLAQDSDWPSRVWECSECGWAGPRMSALEFQYDAVVSIACPGCGVGLATITGRVAP